MKEIEIQKTIMDWLKLEGYYFWRMPVGGVRQQMNGKMIFKKSPVKGFPDIMGVFRTGRLFGIEVKSAKGKLSDSQEKIMKDLIGNNVLYIVARDLETVREELVYDN